MNGRGWIVGALGLCALGLGVACLHTRNQLPGAVRAVVARGLGLRPEAVSFAHLELGYHGLSVGELSAGPLLVRSASFHPSLWSLLGGLRGELLLEGLTLEDPPGAEDAIDRVEVERAEIVFSGRTARARIHATAIYPTTSLLPVVKIAELGIEVDRRARRGRRVAFTGLDAGPFVGLAGGGHVDASALDLRASAPGLQLSVRATGDGALESAVTFEHERLVWDETKHPAPARLGLPRGDLIIDGKIVAERVAGSPLSITASLRAASGTITVPRLSPVPIAATGLALDVHLTSDDVAHLDGELHDGDARVTIAATLGREEEEHRTVRVQLGLPRSDCGRVLAALPSALRRALDGMAVDGEIAGNLAVALPLSTPARLTLDGALDLGCRVLSEPPLADATHLRKAAPSLPALDADGAPRTIVLGPANPSFRRFDQIPRVVTTTFVEAEDGRFWQHHGIDLTQLRRALAHDIELGAPGRGGSTITQQVAKNLFLSGERTLGRKLEESVLAWRLESDLTKRRILELYLNLVELGPGIYGVEEGARHWFGKDVAKLDAREAAALAALLPAPRRGMDAAFRTRLEQLRARLSVPAVLAVPADAPAQAQP